MPVRIPAGADMRTALVLTHADRWHDVHERRRVGVRHVRTDGRGIVRRIGVARSFEEECELARFVRKLGDRLVLDIHVRLRTLVAAHGPVRSWRAVIEEHHVVLHHAEPTRLRIAP